MQVVYRTVVSPILDNSHASPNPMEEPEEDSGFRDQVTGFIITRVETIYLKFYIKLLN